MTCGDCGSRLDEQLLEVETLLSSAWQVVNVISIMLGILASGLALWVHFAANRKIAVLQRLIRAGRDWILSLELVEPANGTEIEGDILTITGKADFRATATQMWQVPRVNLTLREKSVEIVPFVRPLSEAKWWWVQPAPVIDQDGTITGSVFVGERSGSGAGVGIAFQIVLLAVPEDSVSEGDKLVNPPFSFAASNVVTIRRVA